MLEAVTFDPWQVEDRRVVDAPHCGRPSALEQVADLSEDSAGSDLAYVVFAACKVCTCDSALTLAEEVESSGAATLADHDVFGQFLQRLAHRTNELQLTLQDRVRLNRLGE